MKEMQTAVEAPALQLSPVEIIDAYEADTLFFAKISLRKSAQTDFAKIGTN
jgi:hypothetical protein